MFEIIFNIFYPLIAILMFIIPIINLSFNKINKKNLFVLILISYLTTYLFNVNNLFNINHSSNILFPIILMYTIVYLYISSKKIIYSIIISLFMLVILSLCDAIVGVIVMDIFNISYKQATTNLKIYFIMGIIILLFSYLISKLVRFIILKLFDANINLKKHKKIKSIFMFTASVIIVLFSSYMILCKCLVQSWDKISIFLHLSLILCVLAISLTLLYSMTKITKNIIQHEYIDKEYNQLKEYTTMIENISTDLRRFKHDYLNILSTLGEYVEEKDMAGLKEFYYNELLPESNKIMSKDKHLDLLKHIKLTPLKALISSKIINAQALGIETTIEIIDDISNIYIGTIDICRIIGILLDNAIEATLLCDKKFIHFAVIKTDYNIVFIIINTCLVDTPPVYKLFEENFSTKGKGRGIGLKTVKNIIDDNYKNVLINTTIENSMFKQELIIQKNDN